MRFFLFALICVSSAGLAQSRTLGSFSCGFDDAQVKLALQNSPSEIAKLKAEKIDRPVSVICTKKYPEVIEFEFVFESCRGCSNNRRAYLSVTENRRSTYGGHASYQSNLRFD
jgi:hypothetical protein